MSDVKVDQYGNKLSAEDVTRKIKARKMPTVQELFAADCAKRTAQETGVTPDGEKERDDLVVDANDDLGKFVKNQDKDNNTSQSPEVLFDLSSDANDSNSKFESDQNKADKGDVTDTVVPSEDGREEFVAETKGDDLSGFESAQRSEAASKKKAAGCDDKKEKKDKDEKKKKKAKASVEVKVKSRWAKTLGSIMFDPFQLQKTKKKIVAFKIGNDYVLMPSTKPTRTEWRTASKVVAELRDPSIIRKASIVRKGMDDDMEYVEEVDVDVDVDAVDENAAPEDSVVIEETVGEEKEEAAKLEDVLVDLEAGDVAAATEKVQECLSMKEEEIEEAVEESAGEEMAAEVVEEDIVPLDEEIVA